MNTFTTANLDFELNMACMQINVINIGPSFMYSSGINIYEHLNTYVSENHNTDITPMSEDAPSQGPPEDGEPGAEALGTSEESN